MSGDVEPLRLILFDMDGTLIDGAPAIVEAMAQAFAALDLAPPPGAAVRRVIGLDLAEAIQRLAPGPGFSAAALERAVAAYRDAFLAARRAGRGEGASPLYPGARETLERLADTDALLGVATGKARRGLNHALSVHEIERFFTTTQCASEGPGKPHPAMIERALRETGAAAEGAVMVGDAIYDMQMAANAGVPGVGVAWGYHEREALLDAGAWVVIEAFSELEPALDRLWGAGWRRLNR